MSTQQTIAPQQQGTVAAANPPQPNPGQAADAQVQAVAAQVQMAPEGPTGSIEKAVDLTKRAVLGILNIIKKVALSIIMGISATFLLPTIAAIHFFQTPAKVALTIIDKSMKHMKTDPAAAAPTAPNGPAKQGLEKVVDLTKRGALGVLNVIKKIALGIIVGISAVVLLPTALFAYILSFPANALNSVIEGSKKHFTNAPAPQNPAAANPPQAPPAGGGGVPANPPQAPPTPPAGGGGVPANPPPQVPPAGGPGPAPGAAAGGPPIVPPQAPPAGGHPWAVGPAPWVIPPWVVPSVNNAPAQLRQRINWLRGQCIQHKRAIKIAAAAAVVLSASAILYTYS